MILKNKIRVNGKTILSPLCFVDKNDEIYIDSKKISFQKKIEILKLYKPINYICSKRKQDKRKIIYELISTKYKNYIFIIKLKQ